MTDTSIELKTMEIENTNTPSIPTDEFLQEKKRIREERYLNCENNLDMDYLYQLREYKLLCYTQPEEKAYKGNFIWDIQSLKEIPLKEDVDREKLLQFLIQKDDDETPYQKFEELLSDNPNTLVTAMTLLTNNYNRLIIEINSLKERTYYPKDPTSTPTANFLFTVEEEKMFFTGITLLNEFNKIHKDEYIKELIKETEGIICQCNEGLIGNIAKKYLRRAERDDLMQEGLNGLITTIRKFDIDMNLKFSTYATWWIKQAIKRSVGYNNSIRIPEHMSLRINKIFEIQQKLQNERQKEVTLEEAIGYCAKNDIADIPEDHTDLKQALLQKMTLSLQESFSNNPEDESTLLDTLEDEGPTVEEIVEEEELKSFIRNLLKESGLDLRSEFVLLLRYGLVESLNKDVEHHTLEEIGEILGVTRERVRQIESVAIRRVKRYCEERNIAWSY